MKIGKVLLAGVAGGLVMSALMYMARAGLGVNVKLELLLGTMTGLEPSVRVRLIGLAVHLVVSALIALAYAWAFEAVVHRVGWRAGVMVAPAHVVVAGLLVGLISAVHPLVPESIAGPGFFMLNAGAVGLVVFVLVHLAYGAVVGAVVGSGGRRRGRS